MSVFQKFWKSKNDILAACSQICFWLIQIFVTENVLDIFGSWLGNTTDENLILFVYLLNLSHFIFFTFKNENIN